MSLFFSSGVLQSSWTRVIKTNTRNPKITAGQAHFHAKNKVNSLLSVAAVVVRVNQ